MFHRPRLLISSRCAGHSWTVDAESPLAYFRQTVRQGWSGGSPLASAIALGSQASSFHGFSDSTPRSVLLLPPLALGMSDSPSSAIRQLASQRSCSSGRFFGLVLSP